MHRLLSVSRVLRPSYLPAFVALIVLIAAGLYAEQQNRAIHAAKIRASVAAELSSIRSRLEASINGDVQLVRGLIASISADEETDSKRFSQLAETLFSEKSHLRSIAGAPDFVVSLVYPLKGNEKVLGLDYRRNDDQRAAAFRTRDTGQLVLAGPVSLVQGGEGLIARFPVFRPAADGGKHFWGIVSAVLDLQALYRDSGLLSSENDLNIAISGRDGMGEDGALFFGDASVKAADPVTMTVLLPVGSWKIFATPAHGWPQQPDNVWTVRLLILLGGLFIIVPMVISGRLTEERQRNIGVLEENREQLQELSYRLKIALDSSKIGIWELDIASGRLLWDERMKELYGLNREPSETRSDWHDALHPDDLDRAEAQFMDALNRKGAYESEFRVRWATGEVKTIRALGSHYIGAGGKEKIVGVNWDVTADVETNANLAAAKKQAEAQSTALEAARRDMEFNALHDPLTSLPNRRYLDEVLATPAKWNTGTQRRASIFHVDLDRFKEINDTLGHAAGDEILRHAAHILRTNTTQADFVGRIGGDEFVIISWNEGSTDHDQALASRIIEAMSAPVPYKSHECRIGASIGVAHQDSPLDELTKVLVNADIALYEAKRRGRNRYEMFTHDLKATILKTKQTADDILRGLEQNEFTAYYQPQFCPDTLGIIGVEALARWDHPNKGVLPPAAFLKIAEDMNVIADIDQRILEHAMFQMQRWEATGIDIPKVSINISYQRLLDETLIDRLAQMDIPRGKMSFELLESISFDETDMTILSNIEHIKKMGIDIEIDDFGTGFASIISLLKLTPRRLKIDRQLITPILTSEKQKQLVASIIDIGTSLGIEVIAEGVETRDHARILRKLGCHGLQGYAFARPMSANALSAFAQERKWLAA